MKTIIIQIVTETLIEVVADPRLAGFGSDEKMGQSILLGVNKGLPRILEQIIHIVVVEDNSNTFAIAQWKE